MTGNRPTRPKADTPSPQGTPGSLRRPNAGPDQRGARWTVIQEWFARATDFEAKWFSHEQAEQFRRVAEALPSLSVIRAGTSAEESIWILRIMTRLWPYFTRAGLGHSGEGWIADALEAARGRASVDDVVAACWARAWLAYDTMDLNRIDMILGEFATVASSPRHLAAHAQMLGIRALYDRDPQLARARLLDAYRYHRVDGSEAERFIDLSFLAATASDLGDPSAAYDYCEQTLALCDAHGDRSMRSYVIWAFALSAWRAGDHHRAFVLALDGAANAVGIGDTHAVAICLDIAAWYQASTGASRDAVALLGMAESLRLDHRIPSPYLGTERMHHACVDLLLDQLGAPEFLETLRNAGRPTLPDVARWIAAATGTESGTGPTLTPRQTEIATLIAEGLTNKEIARRLLITISTVETHIEHIFRKLDVVSRAQVAAWATAQPEARRRD